MPGLNRYRVYIDLPGLGETEVFPLNDAIRFGWKRDNDVWRKMLPTKLKFQNVPGTDPKIFDILASLELEECGCHRLPMHLDLICGDTEYRLFDGTLMFIDGEWFFDFCNVEIEPRVDDPFECLFKNWKTDTNLLDFGDPVTLTTDTGNYQIVDCENVYDEDFPGSPSRLMTYEDDCLSAHLGDDWQVLEHEVVQATLDDDLYVRTFWVREVFNGAGPPPGGGWTQVTSTFWTRQVILQGPTIQFSALAYFATWEIQSQTLDNGRLLSDILIGLFGVCSEHTFRSDFFGIDPDNTHPINEAYAYAQEWFHNMVIFNMQDVVKFGAFENSTKAIANLEDLLGCLLKFPKLFFYFDEDNQVYRVEHVSYERHNKLMNLVKMRPDAIRGYNSYTYEKVRIPQKETFEWPYKTNDEDWDNASILYEDCNDVGSIQNYEIDCFHTDFGSLIGSGIEDINVLKGLVLVAQKDGQIHRAVGDISGIVKANGGLSWANVIRHLWRWRMPSCSAIVNGVLSQFLSLIPKIKQTTFSAELCCLDILQLHPALDRVRTGLGNGEIEAVELDISSGLAEFVLLHAPPIQLTEEDIILEITISVNDDNQCYFTDFIFQINESLPFGAIVTWDFGSGAQPMMLNGPGPHAVQYTTTGVKTITVTVDYFGNIFTAMTTVTVTSCPAQILGKVLDTYNFGFQGVNVRLFNDANGDGISDGGAAVRSVFTNSAGAFSMATLTPGMYVVVLTQPANWSPIDDYNTGDATGSSNNGNDLPNISPTDLVIPVTIAPSESDGFFTFIQNPNDGIIRGNVQDDLGNPIEDAVINIYADDDLDGVGEGPVLFTTMTDASGNYEITGVPCDNGAHSGSTANTAYGQYVIELEVPSGYVIVSGIDTSNDGDLVANLPTTDNIIPCTIRAGEIDEHNNFIIEGEM